MSYPETYIAWNGQHHTGPPPSDWTQADDGRWWPLPPGSPPSIEPVPGPTRTARTDGAAIALMVTFGSFTLGVVTALIVDTLARS